MYSVCPPKHHPTLENTLMQISTYEIPIETKSIHTIHVFGNAEIMCVSHNGGNIVLHIMQNTCGAMHEKYIELVLNHEEIPTGMGVDRKYIGMVCLNSDEYIYVFERL